MSAVPPVHNIEPRAAAQRVEAPPPEPFGQFGIGRFVLPVLAALSLVLAGVSGTMWYRSYHDADTFERTAGGSAYRVRSIVGRILYYRLDFNRDGPFPIFDTSSSWEYSTFPIINLPPDGWRETWKKQLGVEWDDAPLSQQQGISSGFWLRIRWRTIFILSSILPIIRLAQHYRRQAIARQRGFDVEAS
ncbi:MAG: hypothetical protein H7Z14_09050 [Anaerolineae bacterium]|nr:hypothetical protein [Phycisphaerae bacterium]